MPRCRALSKWPAIMVAALLMDGAISRPARADALVILPGDFQLVGTAARQRLVVAHQIVVESSGQPSCTGEVTEGVELFSSDPAVVRIEGLDAVPVANGVASLTARHGDESATVSVTVSGCERPWQWSFRNHVQSALTKSGCSMGACHGAQHGKNGFKLSLRGYDAQHDFDTLVREARGRRIVPADPARSMLLTKPTGAIPHGGGLRFGVDSHDYRVLSEWIASGTPGPRDEDPRIARVEVSPSQSILKPGMRQQLLVTAHFSDGHSEDVTRWVKFTASDVGVAPVDEQGQVSIAGPGECTVSIWYLSLVTFATVTVPYEHSATPESLATATGRNFIDTRVLEKLAALRIPASPRATDEEFLRRAFIDTIGVLPTAQDTRDFLADTSPDKRDRLIDALLARPEFVDYWTYKWSDLLLVNSEKLPAPAMWAYSSWIRNQVAANTPWDKLVRELLTASGSTLENGATNFFVLHEDPTALSENICQAFLGMSIGCAKCHNHPLEKWTNDQYFAMANLLARVRTKNGPGEGNRIVFSDTSGDLVQPSTGKAQPPTPLDGTSLALDDRNDRREHLAAWLCSPENPYFTRAVVNRVWANFMKVGLVESVDDLRKTNPASNEPLLAALAQHLIDQHYDLRALMRAILQSETYQRSSASLPENAADQRYYSRYYPRRLMAEVLLDAFAQVLGAPSQFPGYPADWRAIQLPDSNVASYFLKTFGRPDRVITCECERTAEPSMVQALHMTNGDAINQKLRTAGNRIEQLLAAHTPDEQLIEEAFLAALARRPSDEERGRLLEIFAATPDAERRAAVEDLYWGLLSSKEFLFNH
ncbi:MAG: DUF1549 and DUF1553 domain-containing protein [Pirellulales bacterium]|nr:DUF1549 and DUF1553 domain-containing protein [Pirellulales bacterium]